MSDRIWRVAMNVAQFGMIALALIHIVAGDTEAATLDLVILIALMMAERPTP